MCDREREDRHSHKIVRQDSAGRDRAADADATAAGVLCGGRPACLPDRPTVRGQQQQQQQQQAAH